MHFPFASKSLVSRLARIIGLLVLATGLAACSAIKLGYNNLDSVAYWWLDSYLELTDEQTPRVRDDLARLHAWHRSQELPRLEALLREIEAIAPGEITAAQACSFVPQLRERLNAVGRNAEPAIVTVALTLAPDQLTHLERKYGKNNEEFRKDWLRLPPAELTEKRFKQLLERMEMVYGTLDDAQRSLLRRQLDRSIFDPRRVLAERQRRQQDALQTLRKLAGQPVGLGEARSLLRGYLERLQASPDASYRKYEQDVIAETCGIISAIHNGASPAQRDSAVRRMRAYQRDLRELSSPT